MLDENKLNNLHQFLTKKNSTSSKKVTLNIRSETTSPSSYNDRNYSTHSKLFSNDIIAKNNIIQHYKGYKKSNTIDKNCYNNINLLTNLKDKEDNIYDSFSKDLNKSNFTNTSKLSVVSVSKNKNGALYNKTLFFQIMKYFTRKTKFEKIKNDEIKFFLDPMVKILNNQRKNNINIKNIKKELEDKNLIKIGKKGINYNNNSINKNKNVKNINILNNNKIQNNNNTNKISTNENRHYIGFDDNFNLTFGKSSNKVEMLNQINNSINNKKNNIKNVKSKNNNKFNNNFIFNTNNFKNNINTIKNKKNNITTNSSTNTNKSDKIEINPKSHRNTDPPILLSEKIFLDRKKSENNKINKEESTPSFVNESNKEDEKIISNTSNQFKNRKINIPKNGINLDSIRLNNHILQNIINRKKNILLNKEKNGNENKKKDLKEFNTSKPKVMDKKLYLVEGNKSKKNNYNNYNYYNKNINVNLNHFNRDYSGKKTYK